MFKQYFYTTSFLLMIISISFISFLPDYNNLPEIASLSDHLNHFIAFFTLSFFFHHGYRTNSTILILYLMLYAVAIEVFQYLLPTRVPGIDDIFADAIGIWLYLLLQRRFNFCKL